MMSEIIAILTLILVIFYQGFQIYDQRKHYEARISNLLDRLMARDFPQYVQSEVAKEQAKVPVQYEEQGIQI
jgi:hypothetical protein